MNVLVLFLCLSGLALLIWLFASFSTRSPHTGLIRSVAAILIVLAFGFATLLTDTNAVGWQTFCSAKESGAECARAWLSSLGSLIAIAALLVAALQASHAKEAAQSSSTSAEAAKVASESTVRTERPYVLIDPSSVCHFRVPQFTPFLSATVRHSLRNYGRTPAILMSVSASAGFFPGDSKPRLEDARAHPQLANLLIASSESSSQSPIEISLTRGQWDKIQKDLGHFYFWGRVDYVDVFGAAHITAFCQEFKPSPHTAFAAPFPELNFRT